tara:strand:- start:407 stop:1297 length:891 start_codon:yes stop_codon:yes gene_type:complete
MIQSMTGFGKAQLDFKQSIANIEIRSLNSKHLDLNIKMPQVYREKELELKKYLTQKLVRGKIEVLIQSDSFNTSRFTINTKKIKEYHQEILKLKKDLNIKNSAWNFMHKSTDIIPSLLKMPEAVIKREEKANQDDWNGVFNGVKIAIDELIKYRKNEGKDLEKDISQRINNISKLLEEIIPLSNERIEKVKINLRQKLELSEVQFDTNRFEQELIFYLEKQDITEEIVRLKSHLSYFLETIETSFPNGKKLGFICQEIGREINTIGSKSSNSEMQKFVVNMKDELEKIKEQLLNIV